MNHNQGKNIQIAFNHQELQYLAAEAAKHGLSVPLYIRSMVLPGDSFVTAYNSLLQRVAALPSGTKFSIRSLFGVDWTMDKGVKLNLGKTYNKEVKSGTITNVVQDKKDASNTMWYVKK